MSTFSSNHPWFSALILAGCLAGCGNLPDQDYHFASGTIYQYQGDQSQVHLPQAIQGQEVRTIGPGAFSQQDTLQEVYLPDSLVNLWDYAFYGCENLSQIQLSSAMTNLGASALESTGVERIFLDEHLAYIGQGAFAHCQNLGQLITHPENQAFRSVDGVLYTSDLSVLVQYPLGNPQKSYQILDSTTSIAPYAFAQAKHLEHLVVPNGVTDLPGGMFLQSPQLTLYSQGQTYAQDYAQAQGISHQEMSGLRPVPLNDGQIFQGYQNKIPHISPDSTLTAGRLPPGLGLYPTGQIYGVAKEAGTFVFAVDSLVGEVAYQITITGEEFSQDTPPLVLGDPAEDLVLEQAETPVVRLYANGIPLMEGVDYHQEREQLTVRASALASLPPGEHTLTLATLPTAPHQTVALAHTQTVVLNKGEEAQNQPIFQDVPSHHWAHSAVTFVARNGLLAGASPEEFHPDAPLTRGMMASILFGLQGDSAKLQETVDLPDVSPEQWYSQGVYWLVHQGYHPQGEPFYPDSPIQRGDCATMLYQFCQQQGILLPMTLATLPQDYPAMSPELQEALAYLCQRTLFSGDSQGLFRQEAPLTRGEFSVVLQNLYQGLWPATEVPHP